MRTLSGTSDFIAEMAILEHISTPVVASPIDMPVIADPVVPRVGHMPRSNTKVGFSAMRPLYIIRSLFMSYSLDDVWVVAPVVPSPAMHDGVVENPWSVL